MTELEKASNSICGVHPDWSRLECFRIGFKEGAQWQSKQSPWISVEERLPERDYRRVLCKSTRLNTQVNVYKDRKFYTDLYCDLYDVDVTHWMPIPE